MLQQILMNLIVLRFRAEVTLQTDSLPFSTRSNTPIQNGSWKNTVKLMALVSIA